MSIKPLIQRLSFTLLIIFFFFLLSLHAGTAKEKDFGVGDEDEDFSGGGDGFVPLVKKEQRKVLVDNEYGQISAIEISDGIRGPHHMHFFTLVPNSLFLPVLLHAQMVFYVHTGSGSLSWANEEEKRRVNLKRGDIFRLDPGSIFYIQSDLETKRESLRIYAIFPNSDDEYSIVPSIGAYSSIRNLVRGFDKITLKRAFKASYEVIESITSATDIQPIVHAISTKKEGKKKGLWEMEARFLKAFLGGREEMISLNKKKQTTNAFNIIEAEPDFENCNGRSLTVTRKRAGNLLKGTNIGLFMVNLTKGSMMGPHWNPRATEIAVVLKGEGMVRVVCSSNKSIWKSECKNMRFRVREGDVFAVPTFHPMAQMSFNNDSFIFMGFSTTRQNNHPQFLAGKQSVLQSLDRNVLALSFNVGNSTIDQLLAPQGDSIILDCTSCAEEEQRMMKEEIEKEKERKREEEERKREEEEARKREEEEEKRREEEEKRKREEERKREDEEARKREEEEERKREEEEARKREEEEERKREEEEKQREEEEERKREEEESRKREEEEEKRREEEEARQREEEEERKREEEEKRREEEEARKREEEEEKRREEEEEKRREEEEARQREDEEEKQREEEEARKREEEKRRDEEEARQREEEEEMEREQEEAGREEEEERQRKQEEEEARKREEEEIEREQEEAGRQEEEERQRQKEEEEEEEERERQKEEARRRQEDKERERQAEREQEAIQERVRQEVKEKQSEKEAGREPEDHDTKTTMDKQEKQSGRVENGKSYLKLKTV
ncbi:vicilin-like seed storage protein At2g18540 [Humulus lupulus]|uniref:vicilin-like seed storage protein At2g18540 n=1 Tax=Humulus lupulus TaxID=3486 RepID=UPI002B40650C|nr:vicilin-like seed storage protein At2g18540 [Humulus lupulus]